MRGLAACCALIVAVSALAEGGSPAPERKTLTIPRVAAPPVVDGNLADWPPDAPLATMAFDPDAGDFRGTARLAWDDRFLYVAFEVAAGKGRRNAGDDPATAYKTGDTVEVFLSVNPQPLEARVPRGPGMDTAKEGD
jgi:hypothetical protein